MVSRARGSKATITPTFGVNFDSGRGGLKRAEAKLTLEIPLTLQGPNGYIAVVAYVGINLCAWGMCWNFETKVFSLTIASFRSWQKTWILAKTEPRWSKRPGDSGMCSDAAAGGSTATWRSPTSCGGRYCRNTTSTRWWQSPSASRVNSAYKKTHTYSGCINVRVTGDTEGWYDKAYVYNSSGNTINGRWGWSGRIDKTVRDCSGSTTVTLESDYSVQRSGLNVTFTPAN